MRTHSLTQAIALGVASLFLTACINSTPGRSGNSAVSKSNQTTSAPAVESNTSQEPVTEKESRVFPTTSNPVVNVYLEISGSMNGYVNGGTSTFQQVVHEYLSGINNAGFASTVNYYYIGSKITPKGNNLDNYITKLTPSSFNAAGGGATTDIGGLFKTILGDMDNNTISIFISDCIISPGSINSPADYAHGQMIDVRNAIVNYVNQYQDLACLVYQFDSGFKGRYFDYQNKPRNVNMQRPFYIWVFGHTYNVYNLKLQYVPDRDFKVAPIRNQWMIFNTPLAELQENNKYGVLLPNLIQNGKYTRRNATTISGIQRVDELYRFSFGANMGKAELLMGKDFIEDTDNYAHVVNKMNNLTYYGVIEPDMNPGSPYTELFRVDSPQPFQKGVFSLAFIPKVPKWAVTCTDLDDRTFNGVNDNKTYGLINIFEGIYNGFNSGGRDNILARFDFEIK